jgi:hypothetical protein
VLTPSIISKSRLYRSGRFAAFAGIFRSWLIRFRLLNVNPRIVTGAIVGFAIVLSVCFVAALTIELRNTFVRALNTVVAISESRRDLDDLRVQASREASAIFRYGRTHNASELEAFQSNEFPRIALEADAALQQAGAPLARIALSHALVVHTTWHLRDADALANNPNAFSPDGRKRHDMPLLNDIETTLNAISADGATIRGILDQRMQSEHDEVMRRLPFIMSLGIVLTFGLSAASVTAVLMARGFYRERSVALRLTSAFESAPLAAVGPVKLDGILMHATPEERVGGDWYDVQALPDGRFFVTIGDVVGHGVDAAVGTATLRRTLLGAAIGESDPAAVLRRTNAVHVRGEGALVATLCAYYDPKTCEFSYASAGLPAPLLRRKNEATFLSYGGPMLGIFEDNIYERHGTTLTPGDTIVLYTDGAIEATHDTIEGEARLANAVRCLDGESIAHELYHALFKGRRPGDDVAIFTLGI